VTVTVAAQLFAIFAFGLVMTGVVLLGVVRAREVAEKASRSSAEAASRRER
jgi:hypothetical protein